MAWKGFRVLRALLAVLHIVSKETKGNGDDKVADVGDKVLDAAEAIATSEEEKQ